MESHPEEYHHREHHKQRLDPFFRHYGIDRRFPAGRRFIAAGDIIAGADMSLEREESDQGDYHPHSGGGEGVMPAVDRVQIPQSGSHYRGKHRSKVYPHVEDIIGVILLLRHIAVKIAQYGGDVRLETAVADNQTAQRAEEEGQRPESQ